MATTFIEIVIDSGEAKARGLGSRDEIEDPLAEALEDSGLGEVTGGGGGGGVYVIDVELDEARFDEGLSIVRKSLIEIGVPDSTVLKQRKPHPTNYSLRGP
jgi:hypothetical protein